MMILLQANVRAITSGSRLSPLISGRTISSRKNNAAVERVQSQCYTPDAMFDLQLLRSIGEPAR